MTTSIFTGWMCWVAGLIVDVSPCCRVCCHPIGFVILLAIYSSLLALTCLLTLYIAYRYCRTVSMYEISFFTGKPQKQRLIADHGNGFRGAPIPSGAIPS